MAVVCADFIPGQAGEVMPDGRAGEMEDGIPRFQALQRVVGFIVSVLEIRWPALQLQEDLAPERRGRVHIITHVAARAEIGLRERSREFIAPLREREHRHVRQGRESLPHAPEEIRLHGVAVVVQADDDVASGRPHQFDARTNGALRLGMLDQLRPRKFRPHEFDGAIRAAIRAEEQFIRRRDRGERRTPSVRRNSGSRLCVAMLMAQVSSLIASRRWPAFAPRYSSSPAPRPAPARPRPVPRAGRDFPSRPKSRAPALPHRPSP